MEIGIIGLQRNPGESTNWGLNHLVLQDVVVKRIKKVQVTENLGYNSDQNFIRE